jgi:hypothetical protein
MPIICMAVWISTTTGDRHVLERTRGTHGRGGPAAPPEG